MNISIPDSLNRFPERIRYGFFSGLIVGGLATIIVSLLSYAYTTLVVGGNFLENNFRSDFLLTYFFIHAFSFIIWLGIFLAIVAMTIPDNQKRMKQSALFFSNAVVSLITYILVNILTTSLLVVVTILFAS